MLFRLYYLLSDCNIPGLGLLKYQSFRAGMAFLLSIIISILLGWLFIRYMHSRRIGESIRSLGLNGQQEKAGTPTMGGIVILFSTIIPTLFLADLRNIYVIIMLVSMVCLGGLGFLDDYIKVFRNKKAGLNGWIKIVGQVAVGLFVALLLVFHNEVSMQNEERHVASMELVSGDRYSEEAADNMWSFKTTIPFIKETEFDYRSLIPLEGMPGNILALVLFLAVVVFIVTAMSNGANLTDGLDGLAAGVSAPVLVVLGIFAYLAGNVIYSDYLGIMYIPGIGEMMVYISAFVGALIGFLWYNGYPARVFMGDTGSLTIGGTIGIMAILVRKELILPLLCGVFFLESLSVILQVLYFKYTKFRTGVGRRIFRMAPLHHHFQKGGLHESHIVLRFWILSLLLSALTLVTLKVR